jgi:hypothetical protein
MKTVHLWCFLSVVACSAAHSQTCSGGAGGGMDSTGNQCNAAEADRDFAPPSAVMARPGAVVAAPTLVRGTPTRSRSTGTLPRGTHTAAAGPLMHRLPVLNRPPTGTVLTAKTENAGERLCQGGADGATGTAGNQCNPADRAGTAAMANVGHP